MASSDGGGSKDIPPTSRRTGRRVDPRGVTPFGLPNSYAGIPAPTQPSAPVSPLRQRSKPGDHIQGDPAFVSEVRPADVSAEPSEEAQEESRRIAAENVAALKLRIQRRQSTFEGMGKGIDTHITSAQRAQLEYERKEIEKEIAYYVEKMQKDESMLGKKETERVLSMFQGYFSLDENERFRRGQALLHELAEALTVGLDLKLFPPSGNVRLKKTTGGESAARQDPMTREVKYVLSDPLPKNKGQRMRNAKLQKAETIEGGLATEQKMIRNALRHAFTLLVLKSGTLSRDETLSDKEIGTRESRNAVSPDEQMTKSGKLIKDVELNDSQQNRLRIITETIARDKNSLFRDATGSMRKIGDMLDEIKIAIPAKKAERDLFFIDFLRTHVFPLLPVVYEKAKASKEFKDERFEQVFADMNKLLQNLEPLVEEFIATSKRKPSRARKIPLVKDMHLSGQPKTSRELKRARKAVVEEEQNAKDILAETVTSEARDREEPTKDKL